MARGYAAGGMHVESVWWPRLRWRMRGAYQWPLFALLTATDAVLMLVLPFHGDGPDGLGAVLLAGFYNLALVGLAAPVVGALLRRRRPDLPRLVANDYAGTWLLVVGTAGLVAAGIAHRSDVAAERAAERSVSAAVHAYVLREAPAWRAGLPRTDAIVLEEGLYRACVPGPDPRRSLCLIVRTTQHPAGVTRDGEQTPNGVYRSAP
jgi:hypothetical protein